VVRLLLMSCRVMSRGVGSVLINHLRRLARDAGVPLTAEFVKTGRNRMMYATYKFNGFSEYGARATTSCSKRTPPTCRTTRPT